MTQSSINQLEQERDHLVRNGCDTSRIDALISQYYEEMQQLKQRQAQERQDRNYGR